MVQRALPDDRVYVRGVNDTLRLLKISGVGARLLFKGVKNPSALLERSKELKEQFTELPERARFILENYFIDPVTGTIQKKKAMKPREDYMAETVRTKTE